MNCLVVHDLALFHFRELLVGKKKSISVYNYIFFCQIARITTNSCGEKIISCKKLVKTKTWHSDFNLRKSTPTSDFDSWAANSNTNTKKICPPKSRIKRRAVLLKGTSIVVTKTQCKSYMVNGNSQFLDKRRWSLWNLRCVLVPITTYRNFLWYQIIVLQDVPYG